MISILNAKAWAVKTFFNFWGRLGGAILNFGCLRDVDLSRDISYGPGPEQRLDILRPQSAKQRSLPVLVYFHGGGWISADKRIYDGIAATLAQNSYLVFNVNYRLAPGSRFPAALQDAAHAIDWIERNLAGYGGDSSSIVLAGDSAGAQIASWYACALQKRMLFTQVGIDSAKARMPLKGLLLFYGVYDFDAVLDAHFPFIRLYAKSFLGSGMDAYVLNSQVASPIRHVSSRFPPVFLCAGERDGLYAQSLAFAETLEKSGVVCKKLLFSRAYRADHGFLFFRWLRSSRMAFAAAGDFLRGLSESAGMASE